MAGIMRIDILEMRFTAMDESLKQLKTTQQMIIEKMTMMNYQFSFLFDSVSQIQQDLETVKNFVNTNDCISSEQEY
jgi:hypothetical protein